MYSPMRLDLKLGEGGPGDTLDLECSRADSCCLGDLVQGILGELLGPDLRALGPAL